MPDVPPRPARPRPAFRRLSRPHLLPGRLVRWLWRRAPRPAADPAAGGDPAGAAPAQHDLQPAGRGPAFGILLGLVVALAFWALLAGFLLR